MPKIGSKAGQSHVPPEALNPNLFQSNCPQCGDSGYVAVVRKRRQMRIHSKLCKHGCSHCDDDIDCLVPCRACRLGCMIYYGDEWRSQRGLPERGASPHDTANLADDPAPDDTPPRQFNPDDFPPL